MSTRAANARVLCLSHRDIAPVISRCGMYEFEDVVGAIDAVDIVAPADAPDPAEADGSVHSAVRTFARLGVKAGRRMQVKLEGATGRGGRRRRPADIGGDYELLFVSAQSPLDIYNLGSMQMWRTTARTSICYVDELYARDIPRMGDLLKILRRFDHLFVSVRATVEPLERATGRPCHFLAPSTDALKFCPYPVEPERVIDFYAMGGSPPETHKALLRIAAASDWYYMYDVVTNCRVRSHEQHRSRLAELIKRSRFFLVTPVRWHDSERTGGEQEMGLRYFEGAAGGAVLIGVAPATASFTEYLGWEDSVIPLPLNSGDIAHVIAELEADPGRLDRISKTNVVNSLRRNDHVYRWAQILATAGLEETEAMADRRRQLEDRAASIEHVMSEVL
ncbi:glycosyltransferase family 1 protein [Mycolicibacterium goodii]|uniref:glycosyltransferase family 1 protein n=1 Tax=Mycolicibacterium goodii TaxID=134601 RepID=UPI00296F8873